MRLPLAQQTASPLNAEPKVLLGAPLPATSEAMKIFFAQVAMAPHSALLLDFDGTLAPFRLDPLEVRPWAGVPLLLEKIHRLGRTRIAIVTGRPSLQVASQLGLPFLEIWGLHGTERLRPDGTIEEQPLRENEATALAAAREAVRSIGLGPKVRFEDKRNAVVVHWRGVTPRVAETLRNGLRELLEPFAEVAKMHLLQFDGGIELRAGRNKGDAVRSLLAEVGDQAPLAYLGDDVTDEDAFRALGDRGLSVLVRRESRASAAQLWLRPPAELRAFLTSWLAALQPPTRAV